MEAQQDGSARAFQPAPYYTPAMHSQQTEMAQQQDLLRRSLMSPLGAVSTATPEGYMQQTVIQQPQPAYASPPFFMQPSMQSWSTAPSVEVGLPPRPLNQHMPFSSLSAFSPDFPWIMPHGCELLPLPLPNKGGTIAPHQTLLNDTLCKPSLDVPLLAPDLPLMTTQEQKFWAEQYVDPVALNLLPFSTEAISEGEKQLLKDINFRYEPPEPFKPQSPIDPSFDLESNALAGHEVGTENDPLVANNPLLKQSSHKNGAPKRPLNAFMIFARRRRPELQKLRGKVGMSDLGAILSAEWRQLTPEQKRVYQEAAAVVRENFHRMYPNYVYQRRASGIRTRNLHKRNDSLGNSSGNESLGSDILSEVLDNGGPAATSTTDSDILSPMGGYSSSAESSAASFSTHGSTDTLSPPVNIDVPIGPDALNHVNIRGLAETTFPQNAPSWQSIASVATSSTSPSTLGDATMVTTPEQIAAPGSAQQAFPMMTLECPPPNLSTPAPEYTSGLSATQSFPPLDVPPIHHQFNPLPLGSYALSRARNGSQGSLSSEDSVSATYNPNSVTKLARHLSMQTSDTETCVPVISKTLNQPTITQFGSINLENQTNFSTYVPSPAFAPPPAFVDIGLRPQTLQTSTMPQPTSWQNVRFPAPSSSPSSAGATTQQYKYGNVPGYPSPMAFLPPRTAPTRLGQLQLTELPGFPPSGNSPFNNIQATRVPLTAPTRSQNRDPPQTASLPANIPRVFHIQVQPAPLPSLYPNPRASTPAPYVPSPGPLPAEPLIYNGTGSRKSASSQAKSPSPAAKGRSKRQSANASSQKNVTKQAKMT